MTKELKFPTGRQIWQRKGRVRHKPCKQITAAVLRAGTKVGVVDELVTQPHFATQREEWSIRRFSGGNVFQKLPPDSLAISGLEEIPIVLQLAHRADRRRRNGALLSEGIRATEDQNDSRKTQQRTRGVIENAGAQRSIKAICC